VSGAALSFNHNEMITVCPGDQTLKIFDVLNFDLNNMIKLNFLPGVCEFIGNMNSNKNLIAVCVHNNYLKFIISFIDFCRSQQDSEDIHIIDENSENKDRIINKLKIHFAPVKIIKVKRENSF
jgi:hypothetical protein